VTSHGGYGWADELRDLSQLVVLFADDSSPDDFPDAALRATECPAYEVATPGEDRGVLWSAYAERLVAEGYRVDPDAAPEDVVALLRSGDLADLTVSDVATTALGAVLDVVVEEPMAGTLVAVALGGGPASLLLISPWTPGGWVSEEIYDHTSLIRLCERWTTSRGRPVLADLPGWRRSSTGDLAGAFTLGAPPPELTRQPGTRRLTRPVPYLPVVELRTDERGPRLLLGNVGPTASAAVRLTVDDDGAVSRHIVSPSTLEDPSWDEVPLSVREGRYAVTVEGPDHFRRRYAGDFPSLVRCECEYFAGGDAWFPDLALTVSHLTTVPVFFWLERGVGKRYGGVRSERLLGPRREATFREQPGARSHGWYDLRVTTSADEGWVQEYSGHLHAGNRPSLTRE
jgi:hypothetical protein